MSNQKHLPNQARANKANKHHKTSGQKHASFSQRVENQPHLIPANLLQSALENPQAARPETVLQLQRQYGNQAVNQLVKHPSPPQPTSSAQISTQPVQRLVDFNFSGHVGFLAGKTRQHDKDFKDIMEAYGEYKNSQTLEEEFNRLIKLIQLINVWLLQYGDKYSGSNKEKDLKALKKLCIAEKRQVEYMYKMEKGKFEYLTFTGSSAHRHTSAEQKLATQYQLTKAELTAIKVYTGGDYKYINPTLLGNAGWFDASVMGMTGPTKANIGGKEVEGPSVWMGKKWLENMKKNGPTPEQKQNIRLEAVQHSHMAVEGLRKLPDINQTTYRGMALSKEQIEREYQVGGTVSHNVFISTSNKPQTAQNFAAENATGGKIGIFFTIQVTKGKDVTMFSEAKGESEILLLPRATFTVNQILKPDHTYNFYRITMTQTS